MTVNKLVKGAALFGLILLGVSWLYTEIGNAALVFCLLGAAIPPMVNK